MTMSSILLKRTPQRRPRMIGLRVILFCLSLSFRAEFTETKGVFFNQVKAETFSELGGSSDSEVLSTSAPVAKSGPAKSVFGWAHKDYGNIGELIPVELEDFKQGTLANSAAIIETNGNQVAKLDFRKNPANGQIEVNYNKKPEQASMIDAFELVKKAHGYFANKIGIGKLLEPETPPLNLVINSKKLKCSAQYREGHLYFSPPDKTCGNAVDPATVFHEYTHYVDSLVDGISDNDLAEGLADMTAAFMTKNPALTETKKGKVTVLRTADNDVKFDYKKANSSDQKTFYKQGQAWSGFAWHAREALIKKYGETKGQERAEDLFFAPLAQNKKSIVEAVDLVFAQVSGAGGSNDDFQLLKAAAERHGFKVKPK